MAAAAAAGLNRNGIRRTAFSTGDLQALSVLPTKNSPSPPDPVHANLHRYKQNIVEGASAQASWLVHSSELLKHQHCRRPSGDVMRICRTISSSSVSAQPSLATVPEASTINMGLSAGMPALQYSSEALVQTEDLSSMSVEELQAELIRTRQAFHSAGALSMSVTIVAILCVLPTTCFTSAVAIVQVHLPHMRAESGTCAAECGTCVSNACFD